MEVRYSKYLQGSVFAADIILLNLSVFYGHLLAHNHLIFSQGFELFLLFANIFWLLASTINQCFKIGRALVIKNHLRRVLKSLFYVVTALVGVVYFFRLSGISRSDLFDSYILFAGFVLSGRLVLLYFLGTIRKKGYNHRQVVILGDKNIAALLTKSFENHPEYGYDILNQISEEQIAEIPLKTLLDKLLLLSPHEMFVCYRQMDDELLKGLFTFADRYGIKIKLVTDFTFSKEYNNAATAGTPVLELSGYENVDKRIRILKRCFDVGFSITVMLLGSPVFLLLYLVTLATSKGPAFYKQERIGERERPFYIYKFRSMYTDSEKLGPQLSGGDHDPRITKWGRVIRKTRLDELPQFWNVLKGDMSVVGPRPERKFYIEKIVERKPSYKRLLAVKPGITSIGQVRYGYAENVDQMCERLHYDLFYLNNINLNNDLGIIMQTVKVMIQRKGK